MDEEIKLKKVGILCSGKYDKQIDSCRRIYAIDGLAPTLTTMGGGNTEPKIMEDFMIYDGFNQRVKKDNIVASTLTSNCGKDLKRNGQEIVENCDVRIFQYGHGYLSSGEINNEISPTVREGNTARYNNAILQKNNIRIRKLTPKECWRLMGFSDDDFTRACYGGDIPLNLVKRLEKRSLTKTEWKELYRHMRRQKTSNSQLYKQAGNSIVVDVLMAIFKELF